MEQRSWRVILAIRTQNLHHVNFQVSTCSVNKKLEARPAWKGAVSQHGSPCYHLWLDLYCLGITAPLLGILQPPRQQAF